MAAPKIFTIPASVPFLPTLIAALVEGTLVPGAARSDDPLALARATLYLPTRRACALARDVFLDVLKTDAAVLPRIVALGDIDADEIAFAEATSGAALALPTTLGGLERRLLLARLILKWAKQLAPGSSAEPALIVATPASALALADDLARLMDDMTTREVSWERLDGLVPDHLDRYWQLTLEFLKIAREAWPNILAEREAIEPAARRDRLIAAEAARLAANPDRPVIVAGSTGSMPATAKFIATLAHLPHGAVVLPGLDTDLDAESWALIGGRSGEDAAVPAFGHPQFALHGLLARLDIERREVTVLGAPHPRERVVSEALRPAETTERWQDRLGDAAFRDALGQGLTGLAAIEAANAEEEVLAIAVALREVLEEPGRTAALVTPDRALARRVMAALGRWRIAAEDSGGDPLAETPAGVFARLAAEAALGGLAPVTLLALLKHDLLRLGAAEGAHRRAVFALERALLRGPRPRAETDGLAQALAAFRGELARLRRGEASDLHPADPRVLVAEADLSAAHALVARLTQALAPLERLDARAPHPFTRLAACHREVIVALGGDDTGAVAALSGSEGEALEEAFAAIADEGKDADLAIALADYADTFRAAIAERVVRKPQQAGARVHIYGLLEARLTALDRVVLGGLAEGAWPPEARSDPWLSRPMRHALGLDLPERRIGLSAHDFAQLLGAREVVLARPAKVAGAPVVASRFWQRLAAVSGEGWRDVLARGEKYLALARALDRPAQVARIKCPEPRPPRAARPTALSVTEIEHWLRDPYTIYAKHILKLARLDPVDMPLGAADRGSAIHGAIGDFAKEFAAALPADPSDELIRIGRAHFAPLDAYPEARAFWWPRFERIARWFAGFERTRRAEAEAVLAEIRGEITLDLGGRQFRLSARADRIERRADGRYAILDFKTGMPPTGKQVRIGLAPQLTLEGAILRRGGFPGVPAASLAELVYVRLKGGEPAGEPCPIDFKDMTADAAADHALAKLAALARRFADEATPYRSLVLSMWKTRYGAYDDLARVKEWSAGANGGEE